LKSSAAAGRRTTTRVEYGAVSSVAVTFHFPSAANEPSAVYEAASPDKKYSSSV
jgi:hypothetical protein